MSTEPCLIVEQLPAPFVELPELLRELASEHQLDSYNCRQRLLGRGQALFARGDQEKLEEIQKLLAEFDIESHLFTPTRLGFAPFLLSGIEATEEELRLTGREKRLVIPQGAKLLICLADTSGELVERSLGQLLSAQRYRGRVGDQLAEDKKKRLILQGRPVIDIYLLNDDGLPIAAARALPGKFDHRGLGEHATLSAAQNLLKLAEMAQKYAGESRLDLNFGLSSLPGATLVKAKDDDLDGLKKNLRNLTRYAWLQADIDRTASARVKPEENDLAAAATAILTAARPELVATMPVVEQVAEAISEAAEESHAERRSRRTPLQDVADLPPPPEIQRHNVWSNPKTIASMVFAGVIALLSQFSSTSRVLGPLLKKGFETGLISGILGLGLFYFAFRRLQLKRLIENTPTSKVRSLAMGMVEVMGTARRQYALVSPMTNIACVFYRLTRYKRNQKGQWVVSSVTSSGQVPFWVEDETGHVSVDPSNATVKPGHRQESFDEGASLGSFSSGDEKWVEELIYDGAKVYVLGEAQPRRKEGNDRTRRRVEALREIKLDKSRRSSFDTNGDGQLDEEEWQAARDAVDDQLLREDLAASEQRRRQEDLVVIGKPRHRGLPLVIAETASETHLTGGYGLSTIVMLITAGLCTALTLWLLVQI